MTIYWTIGFINQATITPGEKVKLTANLVGPIVINVKKKLAKQIVLSDSQYSLRHPIPQTS
jgi:flagellar assembly factor FliW